jgi:flagellar protein FlgJ
VLPAAEQAAKTLGLDKAMLIAQSALETGWGSKILNDAEGSPSFNLFNIKADARWTGKSLATDTLEFLGGQFRSISSHFRGYASIAESFSDFTDFLQRSDRYQHALNRADDGEVFIKELHKAGYATDPNYSDKILDVYRRVSDLIGEQQ